MPRWLLITLCILYILSPIDTIPDFIPVAGWIDDGAVFAYLLKLIFGGTAEAPAGSRTAAALTSTLANCRQKRATAANNSIAGFRQGGGRQ